jgi:thiol-disulfide isomerase/thioredoxin
VGDVLPAVTLSDWQGTPVDPRQVRARVLIIDFWASWCVPCREALPALDAIARRHASAGVSVMAVSIDSAAAAADTFLRKYLPAPAMRMLRDPNGTALARFGAAGMPALYVVDQRGIVRTVEAGFATEKLRDVEESVRKLLEEDTSDAKR